jgi:uncharacterized protein (TIGR03435 family)
MMTAMRYGMAAVGVVALLGVGVVAQKSETAPPQRFEVASVRPAAEDSGFVVTAPQGAEFRTTGLPLSILVQLAFNVDPHQMDIPQWAESVKFDVVAKTPDGVSLTPEQMRTPILHLLEDRFKMTFHHETRLQQGFELVAAKGGPKLTPAKPGASRGGGLTSNTINLPNEKMTSLAGILTFLVKRPVADKTGATGDYEVKFSFARDGETESTLPSIYTALQEQLGLRLASAKVPLEMVVIDHLDRTPTEN